MASIVDKESNRHTPKLNHFEVQTRSFQIAKVRDIEMYEVLRNHILKQKEKEKQEMEMSEELKRIRRHKELQNQLDQLSLGELNEKIEKNDAKLVEMQKEKEELFLKLKKALNEDEERKNMMRVKDVQQHFAAAAAANSSTFGPLSNATVAAAPGQYPPTGQPSLASQVMPGHHGGHSNSSILPSSLHQLQPIQSMFFAPQAHGPVAGGVRASSPLIYSTQSNAVQYGTPPPSHRGIGGSSHLPSSTTFPGTGKSGSSGTSQPQSQPQPSYYNSHHPTPTAAHTSERQIPLSISSASSSSSISGGGPVSFTNERHQPHSVRNSGGYRKRTYEQSSAPINFPTSESMMQMASSGTPINVSSHLPPHYIPPTYRPGIGQPSLAQSAPPGHYPQIGGKIPAGHHGSHHRNYSPKRMPSPRPPQPNLYPLGHHVTLEQIQTLPLYHSMFGYHMPPGGNPMPYLPNSNQK